MRVLNFRFHGSVRKCGSFKSLLLNSNGTTVVTFALILPVLLSIVGVGIDFGTLSMKRSTLQAAGDAAALAGAKELSLASATDSSITQSALAFLKEQLKSEDGTSSGEVKVDRKKGSVTVTVTEVWTPFFAQFISSDVTPVISKSTASLAGETKICVLALKKSGPYGFSMQTDAHLEANGCGIYANSTDKNAIYLGGASTISAAIVCSSGGIFYKGGSILTSLLNSIVTVLTDCPAVPDPLASRAAPTYGACNYTNMVVSSGSVTLNPGVYCGGLRVENSAIATLAEGTYVMKDGLFRVKNSATIKGKNVSFFMTGLIGMLWFTDNATIDLSGAETGSMAGLLFFDDPKMTNARIHKISASNAHTLTGTIYFPHATLVVDPNANVGEKSAYTAIVAERISVEQGPNLVLNSDYGATAVPVPDGIRSTTSVVLSN